MSRVLNIDSANPASVVRSGGTVTAVVNAATGVAMAGGTFPTFAGGGMVFNGTSQSIIGTEAAVLDALDGTLPPFTLYVVHEPTAASAAYAYLGFGGAASNNRGYFGQNGAGTGLYYYTVTDGAAVTAAWNTGAASTRKQIVEFRSPGGGQVFMRVNGGVETDETFTTTGALALTHFAIGARVSASGATTSIYYSGVMYEVSLYNEELATGTRDAERVSLAAKWDVLVPPFVGPKIATFGDSNFYGAGSTHGSGPRQAIYDGTTGAGLNVFLVGAFNAGTVPHNGTSSVSGSAIAAQVTRAQTDLGASGPFPDVALAFWMGGTNNIPTGAAGALTAYQTGLEQFHTALVGGVATGRLVVTTIVDRTTYTAAVDTFNAGLVAIWDAFDAAHPTHKLFRADVRGATGVYNGGNFDADGIHLNDAGHILSGNAMLAAATADGTTLSSYLADIGAPMGTLSADLRTRGVDHTLGVAAYTPPATIELAAYVAGVEVAVGSYVRKSVANNTTTWSAASGRAKTNAIQIQFITATAAWGTIDEIRGFNPSTGAEMFAHTLAAPVAVANGQTLTIAAGDIDITAPAGAMTTTYVHKFLDLAFGATAYTAEASLQFAYYNGDPQGAGAETAGAGYTRTTVASNGTSWASATAGLARNLIDFPLGTAGANWTAATYCALFNAAGSGLVMSAALPATRNVLLGETEVFQATRLRPQML